MKTFLDTTRTLFLDETGQMFRDGFPRLIVGGHETVEIIDFSKISNEIKDMWDNGYKTLENGNVSADLGEEEAQILLNKENFPEPNYKYME